MKLKLLRWNTVKASSPTPNVVLPPGGQKGQNGGAKNRMVMKATHATDVQPTSF